MKIIKEKQEYKPYSISIETQEEHNQLQTALTAAINSVSQDPFNRSLVTNYKSPVQIFLEKLRDLTKL